MDFKFTLTHRRKRTISLYDLPPFGTTPHLRVGVGGVRPVPVGHRSRSNRGGLLPTDTRVRFPTPRSSVTDTSLGSTAEPVELDHSESRQSHYYGRGSSQRHPDFSVVSKSTVRPQSRL